MIITYIRSSSAFGQWGYCQNSYFLDYVLGYKFPANLKADLGTVVHKVYEVLASIKKEIQINKSANFVIDEQLGKIHFNVEDLLKERKLTESEIIKINSSRVNKNIYKWNCNIKSGHKRYGEDLVNNIFELSFAYYIGKRDDWKPVDKRDALNWTWMGLDYKNGEFDPRKREVVDTETHFDFEIDKPWARFEYIDSNGEPLVGNLRCKGTIDFSTRINGGLEIIDWKGLPLDTKIPTPNGWTTMSNIKVGDFVFDDSGKQTKVIGKSKIKTKNCYKIYFDDTTTVICDDEHLWKLNNGSVVATLNLKNGDKISVSKPLEIMEQQLPIDPYVLGVWLGDGRNKNSEISSQDHSIYKEIKNRGYKVGKNINKNGTCPSRTIFELKKELLVLNLLNNKHIPKIYLRSSYQQRLDLLRGLMDTDGNVNRCRKQAVFTTCNQQLSNDVKELLLSLGQRPNQSFIKRKTNFSNNKEINVYPLHFRPIDINPFLLKRKAKNISNKWSCGLSNRRLIQKIEYIGQKQTQCIMVDSDNHTYLCTENMIPTHNTGQRKNWATGQEKTYEKLCEDEQLMFYYYALRKIYPKEKNFILTIFFIRDGGPFSICFDDSHIEIMENKIQKRFEEIKNSRYPRLLDPTQKDFRCEKLCPFYKNKFHKNDDHNMCRTIHNVVRKHGIEYAINEFTNPNHNISHYNAPGK